MKEGSNGMEKRICSMIWVLRTGPKDSECLDEVHKHNRTEVQEGTEDTSLIDAQLSLVNKDVDILNGIMGNIYEFQPEKLRAWKLASRVERDPNRAQKSSPAPGNPA